MPTRSIPEKNDCHLGDWHLERDGHVLYVSLNRAADSNPLTETALRALENLALELMEDQDIQVVVFSGTGPDFFSSGILNPALRESLGKTRVLELVRLANRAFNAVERLPQIVIGALNGTARAGGAELALACDMLFASTSATMFFPEVGWGGFPGAGGPMRLAHIVGRARALELICTGREVRAEEMERLGIVLGTFSPDALRNGVQRVAERIAAGGPFATRGAKRIMAARLNPGTDAASELSDALRTALEWSPDVDEAIAAHKEGRPANFTGRY